MERAAYCSSRPEATRGELTYCSRPAGRPRNGASLILQDFCITEKAGVSPRPHSSKREAFKLPFLSSVLFFFLTHTHTPAGILKDGGNVKNGSIPEIRKQ